MADDLVVIALRRVRAVMFALTQPHELGVVPGTEDDIANPDYQRAVLPIYASTLSRSYRLQVAAIYGAAAARMTAGTAPLGCAPHWQTLRRYLEAIAMVFPEPGNQDEHPVECTLPAEPASIIRYADLAQTMSADAARHMLTAVEELLASMAKPRTELTALQLAWVRQMAHGERIVDIAREHGYSERSMYREMNKLWPVLGVSGRAEAIAEVGRRGLLDF